MFSAPRPGPCPMGPGPGPMAWFNFELLGHHLGRHIYFRTKQDQNRPSHCWVGFGPAGFWNKFGGPRKSTQSWADRCADRWADCAGLGFIDSNNSKKNSITVQTRSNPLGGGALKAVGAFRR